MTVEEYKRIMKMAIEAEIEAYEFYLGVVEKVQDSTVKDLFRRLANDENDHRSFLEGLLSGNKLVRIDETKDYKVSATVDKPSLSISMKPVDAIALAMKKEEEAMNMYTELGKISVDKEQKELFEGLARMELGHKSALEDLFTNMAFPEVW